MKAVVAGAGVTGKRIAEYLINAGYNVTFIDNNIDTIREVTDSEGIAGMYGQCTSLEAMKNVGIKEADLFIAVTSVDEINIIACEVAHFFGVKKRIAKITNSNYLTKDWVSNMYGNDRIAITSVVTPDVTLIDSLIKRLSHNYSNIGKVIDFLDGKVKLVSIFCNTGMRLLNSTVQDFYKIFEHLNIKIVAVLRGDNFINITDNTLLKSSDTVIVIVESKHLQQFFEIVSEDGDNKLNKYYDNNHVTIIGDNPSILYLAKQLIEQHNTSVNILINDKEKAENLAKDLQRIGKDRLNIIYTSSFEKGIKDLYLRSHEKIIIFNQNDRENVFLSLYCKYNNISNIFCILQNSTYEGFMYYNGINNVYIADQYIMLPIMDEIKSPYENNVYLIKHDFEMLELTISPKSIFIGKNLRDLKLPIGIEALAALSVDSNNEYLYIKDTNLLIQERDVIIFLVEYSNIKKANDLFNQYID